MAVSTDWGMLFVGVLLVRGLLSGVYMRGPHLGNREF